MRATLLMMTGAAALACGAMLAPAAVATAAESAQLTIATLEAQGFDVKVNKIGSAPLSRCVITDIRNPRERTELVRRGDDFIQIVAQRSITVTADCSRR
ncbi:hypothetical protein [Mycolicibacterium phlei]|uniref:PASTA domain-containing protein n=1 Tax=Mycolicibacterium phlei DSM 43239 = CCUG 21000 TaxID=1226750 RepID=A0A5N5V312_MYCPH|nr:hypothetical protein [Mycolicibacterium phlei]EID17299.1 hypothetical protein MPHLEI_04243 [Mycolicibacterium phlei RIVM601174]KAB7756078.1 hypothetical protein MPHL21000_12515 [Mycolicibacterium phlei DSM 43239 = CCUG 21000]KXW65742.1 hypothetical protein MPHL43239_09980 [Mycolicibacterium phlei DSM 43239 = CCUG 21000]KXW77494.1 hypothetical protein JL15_11205 [Mycolicibacterium phlei DSM 43071]MBF4191205.1 hypothetical protein [Mycolicibacterium phlei]